MKFIIANILYVVMSFYFGTALALYREASYRTIILDKLMIACICIFLLSGAYWYCNQLEQ